MGPNLVTCNEISAYVMPCVTAHAVTSCAHHVAHARRQISLLYVNMVHQKLLMDTPFVPAKLYLRKVAASRVSILNMKIANQNMLKRILIAMHNENKADCNENSRICAEEPSSRLQKACRDGDITITSLVLVHFGLIK